MLDEVVLALVVVAVVATLVALVLRTGGPRLRRADGAFVTDERGALPPPRPRAPPRAARKAPSHEDEELRQVFVAEARGEISKLRRGLPRWRQAPADQQITQTLRRSFHTLKGSGRLVGAVAIGDFSEKVEKLLLGLIEREIALNAEVVDVVTRAIAALPGLVAEFTGEGAAGANAAEVVAEASRLLKSKGAARPAAGTGRPPPKPVARR